MQQFLFLLLMRLIILSPVCLSSVMGVRWMNNSELVSGECWWFTADCDNFLLKGKGVFSNTMLQIFILSFTRHSKIIEWLMTEIIGRIFVVDLFQSLLKNRNSV